MAETATREGDDSPARDRRAARAEGVRPSLRVLGWIALFFAAFLLRLTTVRQYEAFHPGATRPVIDEASYDGWAREIAAGDWLGDEVFFQEPLYPYALALAYRWFETPERQRDAARRVHAVLGALWVLGVLLLTRRLFGARAGWLAGMLAAIYGPTLQLSCLLLKPNLFLPLWTAAAIVWLRPRHGWKSATLLGLLLGAGVLLRGNVLVLLPFFLAWALLAPCTGGPVERRGRTAGLLLGLALALVPVAARNAVVGDVFVLSTSGAGTNLYGGNSAENPYGVATELGWVRGIPEFEADDWRREAERRSGVELNPAEVSRFWVGALLDSVRERPALHLSILWNKLRLTLGAYEVPDNHDIRWDARFVPLLRRDWPGFGVVGPLALAGALWLLLSERRRGPERRAARLALGLLALLALYVATIVLTVTSSRIRLGVVPLALPFAGYFASEAAAALTGRRWSSLAALGALLLSAGLFVHWPVFDTDEVERNLAERDYNYAVQVMDEEGGLNFARTVASRLLARYPRSARFRTLLAEAEFRTAFPLHDEEDRLRREDARQRIQASLDRLKTVVRSPGVSPRERYRASRLAGWILLQLGRPGPAARHFERALAFDDEDFELRLSLAQAWLSTPAEESAVDPARVRALVEGLAAEAPDHPGVALAVARLAELRRSAKEGG